MLTQTYIHMCLLKSVKYEMYLTNENVKQKNVYFERVCKLHCAVHCGGGRKEASLGLLEPRKEVT